MEISEEKQEKLVIKNASDPTWLYILLIPVIGLVFAAIAIGISGTAGPSGNGRTTGGAAIFFLPVVGAGFLIWEVWRRRKSLVVDSAAQTVSIVGKKTLTFPFSEACRFALGRTQLSMDSQIDLELKNGQRIPTGIAASKNVGAETVSVIMQKLSDRLKSTAAELRIEP
jgi:hypothetical protein